MSISTEISRIQTATADIKTAIAGKGVTVPTGSQIDDLPALITSIPSGGGLPVNEFWNWGTLKLTDYGVTTTLVIDCTNFTSLSFNYDFNQAVSAAYQCTGYIQCDRGKKIIRKTNGDGNLVQADTNPTMAVVLSTPGASVLNGTYTVDVTNYTSVVISLNRYPINAGTPKTINGSIRVYNIEGA